MTIEVVRYEFEEYPDQLRIYFTKVMKLIIISKLNCLATNRVSVMYFHELVKRIQGCDYHSIKYGKPMLFTKFMGYEFNYHVVQVTIRTLSNYTIEISIESIIQEFVRVFDKLSSDTREIKWNILPTTVTNYLPSPSVSPEESTKKEKISITGSKGEEKVTFYLLDSFIVSLHILMNLSVRDKVSLLGKNIEIKDVSLTRKILNIEMLVDDETIILDLNPKSRDKVVVSLDNDIKIGETIKNLMLQNYIN